MSHTSLTPRTKTLEQAYHAHGLGIGTPLVHNLYSGSLRPVIDVASEEDATSCPLPQLSLERELGDLKDERLGLLLGVCADALPT